MTFTVVINVFDVVISFYTNHHDCSPSLVRHITVQSSASFTVRIGWPIQLSKTFSCLFLFMLTLPLHEIMIPLFFAFCFLFLKFFFSQMDPALLFIFSSPFYPTYLFPFIFLICFLFDDSKLEQIRVTSQISHRSVYISHSTSSLFF